MRNVQVAKRPVTPLTGITMLRLPCSYLFNLVHFRCRIDCLNRLTVEIFLKLTDVWPFDRSKNMCRWCLLNSTKLPPYLFCVSVGQFLSPFDWMLTVWYKKFKFNLRTDFLNMANVYWRLHALFLCCCFNINTTVILDLGTKVTLNTLLTAYSQARITVILFSWTLYPKQLFFQITLSFFAAVIWSHTH